MGAKLLKNKIGDLFTPKDSFTNENKFVAIKITTTNVIGRRVPDSGVPIVYQFKIKDCKWDHR